MRDIQVRVAILTGPMTKQLMADGMRGKAGRQILMERFGPQLKTILDKSTRETKALILKRYQTAGFVPGNTKPTRFLGGYERSVRRVYRAQTAQTWPWAYVGLYPQEGGDTLQSRNPNIYVPSIERGASPAGWTESPKTSSGGWTMFERLSYWAQVKMGINTSTRQGHTYVWLLFKKILSEGTKAHNIFDGALRDPEFQRLLASRQGQITSMIKEAFGGR